MDARTQFPEQQLENGLTEELRRLAGERTEYPRNQTVAELFETAAAAHGTKTALVCGAERVSYGELNVRANRLAHRLRSMGVGPETTVGVCLDRSPELIVALVAILKAGGAYVPFDAAYPEERLKLMLDETRPQVMITQASLAGVALGVRAVPAILMDEAAPADVVLNANQVANLERLGSATDLAYVMYTSGSTGKPKGVMVENRSIVRLVFETNFCRFGAEEVFLQFAPISFDASTFEIWGALLHGSTLVLMPQGLSSLEDLSATLREHKVTTLWLTSGLFNLFVDEQIDGLGGVRQLLAGGDALSAAHVRKALAHLPEVTVINGYGPTEGTTFTCCHILRPGDAIPNSVPIGRPISSTTVYILDQELRPVARGEQGELFAGGDGVARGYMHAPAMTAEKFLPDPFSADPAARMYRTGDLARWREDGTIEFLGRADTQVKILGHRIEMGEIESALLEHPAVRQACVIAENHEGSKRLVAYVVAGTLENAELKEHLAAKLPAYMVPAIYVQLSALPLDPNGKVDRAALPKPKVEAAAGGAVHGEMEQAITQVWTGVLHLDSVGPDDNFFDLGGDSLLLVAAHSRLQKLLGIQINVTDLFEFTTVRTLAKHLGGVERAPEPALAVQEQTQKRKDAFARFRQTKGVGQ